MLFALICVDKPDHNHVRAENRAKHLDYLEALGDRLIIAGPTLSEDGEDLTGSIIIVDCANRAAAEKLANEDPYKLAGLFKSVTIKPFRKVFPKHHL